METHIKTEKLNWEASKIEGFSAKQLLNLSNGTFKMIKVEPHSSYPHHQHPDKTEFVYVLKGNVQIINGEKTEHGAINDFFILPCATMHSISNLSDHDCILLVGAIKQ